MTNELLCLNKEHFLLHLFPHCHKLPLLWPYILWRQIKWIPKCVFRYTRKRIIRCPFQSMAVAEAEPNATVCLIPKQPKNSVAVCAFHLGTLKHVVSKNLHTVPAGRLGITRTVSNAENILIIASKDNWRNSAKIRFPCSEQEQQNG